MAAMCRLVFAKPHRSCRIAPGLRCLAVLLFGATLSSLARAHDYRAGDARVVHPYATPSMTGLSSGAAYLASLENTGSRADRLLRASTPRAGRVELHQMGAGAQGVMRMRSVGELALLPGALIKMRPGRGLHFTRSDLKRLLEEGQTFPMTLECERGGKVEVKVVVQVPRARPDASAPQMH